MNLPERRIPDVHLPAVPSSNGPELDAPFRQLAETLPQLVWTAQPEGGHDYFNRRWYEYTGLPEGSTHGEGWRSAFHPEDVPEAARRWAHSLRTGEPYEVEYRCRRRDGVYQWFLGRAQPMRDVGGRIIKWFGTCTDIDAQKRAADSLLFLAEASALLSSSLDYETTLEALTRLTVPRLADWCSLEILGEDGVPRLLGVAHVDAAKVRLAWELRMRYPPDPKGAHGVYQVLRTGRAELLTEIPEALLVGAARDAEHLRISRELGLRSSLVVPLTARGRTFGALQLVTAESGRSFTPADLALAEQLAARASLAVDNARLYREAQEALRRKEEEQRISEALQRVGMTLAAELEPSRLMQTVTDTAVSLTGASFGAFLEARVDEQGEKFMLSTTSGVARERFLGLPPARSTPLFALTFRGEATVLLADVRRHPAYPQSAASPLLSSLPLLAQSYLAVPLKSRSGEVLGGLFFSHAESGRFLPVHARLAEGVAAQAAVALDNARLYHQVRQAEERFRTLVTATSQAVWSTQPDGMVEEDSPSWRAFTGQSYEDYRGFGWLSVVHPEDQERVRRGWEAARLLKQPYEVEMRVRRAQQGDWAIMLWRAVPLMDGRGQVREWLGTSTDITAQRQAEEASRRLESVQRMRQLESLRARVNEILSREEPPVALMQAFTEAMVRAMPALALVQLWSFQAETQSLRLDAKSGLDVPASLQPSRLPLGEGFAGLVGRSRQPLLVNDVQGHPNARSHDWMRAQGLVSYVGIPLVVSGRLVGVLSIFAPMPLEEETLTTLATVAEALAQGLERRRAEQSLQSHASSRADTHGPELKPLESGVALDKALVHLQTRVAETGASIIQGRLPRVMADEAQLTQLFQHLVGNALQFRGGSPPRVLVEAERQGEEWRFTVEDNGIGIEPQSSERIFSLFQRPASPEESPGTGLGLALCKKIVERHGGRIGLDSQPGQGTTFWFTLPAAPLTA